MINVEVWVPPENDTIPILDIHHVRECGTIAPPIRFGWFIPNIKNKKPNDQSIHWTMFTKATHNYDVQEYELLKLIKTNSFKNRENQE